MSEELPTVWTLDREGIEASLMAGRSARRDYTQFDKTAIREVLDRDDFDELSEAERSAAFSAAIERLKSVGYIAPSPGTAGSRLAMVGWVLTAIGGAELAFAYLGYGTSIHSDMDYVAGSFMPARDTINIGLLQNQLMLFQLGLVVLLAGLVFVGLGMAVTALTPRDRV